MARKLELEALLGGCADDSFDDGIRIDTELEPLAGAGAPVKPAVYEGAQHQMDRRWKSTDDTEPTPVIVIDNVPSQANRLEDALRQHREAVGVPELTLELSQFDGLPAHLPKSLSSLQFPHRNADAYLRDAQLSGDDFLKTELGRSVFDATAGTCGPLMAWFPQALLYGFWQSHLGKKRTNSKHARAWVSEIIGWQPAANGTKTLGLKGDPLNLSKTEDVTFSPNDQSNWNVGEAKAASDAKKDKLSELGHGQALFMRERTDRPLPAAAVSFVRITQRATVSFAHLRRVSLNLGRPEADAAARALLVALGLHAHLLAFGRGFALRSGCELRPKATTVTYLGANGDEQVELRDATATGELLQSAKSQAKSLGVPVDGWDVEPLKLTPKDNLVKAIKSTWPKLDS